MDHWSLDVDVRLRLELCICSVRLSFTLVFSIENPGFVYSCRSCTLSFCAQCVKSRETSSRWKSRNTGFLLCDKCFVISRSSPTDVESPVPDQPKLSREPSHSENASLLENQLSRDDLAILDDSSVVSHVDVSDDADTTKDDGIVDRCVDKRLLKRQRSSSASGLLLRSTSIPTTVKPFEDQRLRSPRLFAHAVRSA